jgi:Flp pilus assembly protein TadB
MRTGNITAALTEFEKSVNHKKLREIIHNISVCSRYDTDYEAVIGDSRKMLQDYLTGKAQERAILNSARIEYISIALIAGVLFWMIGDFMEVDLEQMLLHTTVGSAFIFYFIVVVFIAVLNLFIIEGGRD